MVFRSLNSNTNGNGLFLYVFASLMSVFLLTSEVAVAVASVFAPFLSDFFVSDFSLSDFFSLPMVYTWPSRVWSPHLPFSKSSRFFSNENGHCK